FRHRVAPPARAPGARTARIDRRDTRLYGARTDRTNEPFDRLAERPLRTRRHPLRDAHRLPSVYGFRSDGVGSLPYSKDAGATPAAVEKRSGPDLRNNHEAAGEDCRGALPDSSRPRK